ncbi:MAG: glutamine hydrolyzing CTP synthase [Candidatus Micrarchaeia archaeon]
MSGLGKGVANSSILKIFSLYKYKVLPIKFDGYLNYDCGTMNPYRHGEVFVLDDKSEVDMDFGMYERFLGKDLTGELSITGGKLFSGIIEKERRGDFLGADVQIIPHLTDYIIEKVESIARKHKLDVLIIEVGGTVGDIENSYFIEAMRQLSLRHKTVFMDVTYVPKLGVVGEQKTKPTQYAFRTIMGSGITPSYILCRSSEPIEEKTKNKIALYTNIEKRKVIDDSDMKTIYRLPLHFIEQGFDKMLITELGLKKRKIDEKKLKAWKSIVKKIEKPKRKVTIAIVGKYTELRDSYISVKEALIHAGAKLYTGVNIKWIESSDLEDNNMERLGSVDGIVVPGGFGNRGIEGKINVIRFARENKVPFLGLCLGMQLMVIEFARNVCKLEGANSTEFNPKATHNVIDLIPSQRGIKLKGATMRLGAWKCKITDKNSIAFKSYKKSIIYERHRHRYEINNKYRSLLEKNGLAITGVTPDNNLVEIVEWRDGFGIGTQAHPELKSKVEMPAPLFVSFVEAAIKKSRKK